MRTYTKKRGELAFERGRSKRASRWDEAKRGWGKQHRNNSITTFSVSHYSPLTCDAYTRCHELIVESPSLLTFLFAFCVFSHFFSLFSTYYNYMLYVLIFCLNLNFSRFSLRKQKTSETVFLFRNFCNYILHTLILCLIYYFKGFDLLLRFSLQRCKIRGIRELLSFSFHFICIVIACCTFLFCGSIFKSKFQGFCLILKVTLGRFLLCLFVC